MYGLVIEGHAEDVIVFNINLKMLFPWNKVCLLFCIFFLCQKPFTCSLTKKENIEWLKLLTVILR